MTGAAGPLTLAAVYATLIAVAALWGSVTGLLVPRAAYRLSVEPDEEWRSACPAGHPFTGPARGWLGGSRCPRCTAVFSARSRRTAEATAPREPDAAPVPSAEDRGTPASAEGPETPVPGTSDRPPKGSPAPTDEAPTDEAPADTALVAAPISAALVTALVCTVLAATTGARPELAVWLLLTPFAVLLALVDRTVHRLPDGLTLPLAAGAAVLLGLAELLPGDGGSWPSALLGGLVLGAAYFMLFLIHPNGMGFGDVKLALSLGVVLGWYGWTVLFAGAFAGFLLGSLYGLGLMALRRASRKTAIPFGPFMIVGALAGMLLGGLAATG